MASDGASRRYPGPVYLAYTAAVGTWHGLTSHEGGRMVARRGWSFACWSLVLAGLVMIFLGGAAVAQAAQVNVTIGDNFFDAATLTVQVGDTVTWKHTGNRPHDVTADNGAFASPRRMANGDTFSYTATTP